MKTSATDCQADWWVDGLRSKVVIWVSPFFCINIKDLLLKMQKNRVFFFRCISINVFLASSVPADLFGLSFLCHLSVGPVALIASAILFIEPIYKICQKNAHTVNKQVRVFFLVLKALLCPDIEVAVTDSSSNGKKERMNEGRKYWTNRLFDFWWSSCLSFLFHLIKPLLVCLVNSWSLVITVDY